MKFRNPASGGIYEDIFLRFLRDFKKELGSRFRDVGSWDKWVNISGTAAWKDALIVSSKNHMPEVFALWDKLDWWASDMLDSWLIDCAEYMGLIQKTEKEEANMGKPRICEILGVGPGEEFFIKDFYPGNVTFRIMDDGTFSTCPSNISGSTKELLRAINHPDRIIRKSRFTEQEVEDAKTIKRMFGADNFTHIHKNEDGWPEMMDGPGEDGNIGCCSIGMEEGMFPSLRPGETVTLDEIIGGTRGRL